MSYKIFNSASNRVVCGACETRYHTDYRACPECAGGNLPYNTGCYTAEIEAVAIVECEQ